MVRNQMNKKILFLTYLSNSINQLWGKQKVELKKTGKLQKTIVSIHAKGEEMEDGAEWKVCVITV